MSGLLCYPRFVSLSPEQVKKIAELARLELEESEVQKYAQQLSNILEFVEKLNKLDLSGIEPTAHAVSVATPFREDQTVPFQKQEAVLSGAPDREGPFFRVPKVL